MDGAKLRMMAAQIARNFAAQGEDAAASATADHIEKFWDPRMKAQLLADGPSGLDPVTARAVGLLQDAAQPQS